MPKFFVFASRASLLATFCAPLTKLSWYKKMQEATLLATFRKRSGACQLRLRFLTQRQNQKRGKRRFSFRFSPLASPIFLFHFACGHPFSLRDAHVSYVSYVHIVLSKNPILDSYGMYILFKLLGGWCSAFRGEPAFASFNKDLERFDWLTSGVAFVHEKRPFRSDSNLGVSKLHRFSSFLSASRTFRREKRVARSETPKKTLAPTIDFVMPFSVVFAMVYLEIVP